MDLVSVVSFNSAKLYLIQRFSILLRHSLIPKITNKYKYELKKVASEGNGNPLQYSCLENPRDREAWWAAVYGVAQSWT